MKLHTSCTIDFGRNGIHIRLPDGQICSAVPAVYQDGTEPGTNPCVNHGKFRFLGNDGNLIEPEEGEQWRGNGCELWIADLGGAFVSPDLESIIEYVNARAAETLAAINAGELVD